MGRRLKGDREGRERGRGKRERKRERERKRDNKDTFKSLVSEDTHKVHIIGYAYV